MNINIHIFSCIYVYIFIRDSSSFDIMLLHFKLQICFVLPGFISAIIMPAEFSIKTIILFDFETSNIYCARNKPMLYRRQYIFSSYLLITILLYLCTLAVFPSISSRFPYHFCLVVIEQQRIAVRENGVSLGIMSVTAL